MFKTIIFPLLILSSMIGADIKRKRGGLRRNTDYSHGRRHDSHHSDEPSDFSAEYSNRHSNDVSEDHFRNAANSFEGDSYEPRGQRRSNNRRNEPSSRKSRTTVASTITEELESPVSNQEPDTTLEDFDIQNEELREYINKLRKRVTRLKHVKIKFGDVQRNYVLRDRMDTIERKYLNNIEFIRQNQDYNETLMRLILTFNEKRKTNGWKQQINVTQIIVMEKIENEKGNVAYKYPNLPKLFLTRQEKWHTCIEWLQNLSPKKVLDLKESASVFYYLQENIFEQFEERPLCSSEIAAGMDGLYGIASMNVKIFQEISDFEKYKISKMSLRSLDENKIISKCKNVLLSLQNT